MEANESLLLELAAQYKSVVLLGNSEQLDLTAVLDAFDDQTLFVLFGSVRKILNEPFSRPALLVHRLREDGSVNKPEHITQSQGMFAPGALIGRAGVFAGKTFDGPKRTGEIAIREPLHYFIDGDPLLHGWYTNGKTGTTGFITALWFARHLPEHDIVLAGFSGTRGTDIKMFTMHDWTLEQAALRLEARRGALRWFEGEGKQSRSGIERLALAYPDRDGIEIASVYADVLRDQFAASDRILARMWSMLRFIEPTDRLLVRLGLRRR